MSTASWANATKHVPWKTRMRASEIAARGSDTSDVSRGTHTIPVDRCAGADALDNSSGRVSILRDAADMTQRDRLIKNATKASHREDILSTPADTIEEVADYVMTDEEVEAEIAALEQEYGMTSEEMLRRLDEDTLEESFDLLYWEVLLRYR
jgi:hypothetical protein